MDFHDNDENKMFLQNFMYIKYFQFEKLTLIYSFLNFLSKKRKYSLYEYFLTKEFLKINFFI